MNDQFAEKRKATAMERIADAVEILASGVVHEQMRNFVEAHEGNPDREATRSFAAHLEKHYCPVCKRGESHEPSEPSDLTDRRSE